jgi:hypothetical protein
VDGKATALEERGSDEVLTVTVMALLPHRVQKNPTAMQI